jgi:hypothetical protein
MEHRRARRAPGPAARHLRPVRTARRRVDAAPRASPHDGAVGALLLLVGLVTSITMTTKWQMWLAMGVLLGLAPDSLGFGARIVNMARPAFSGQRRLSGHFGHVGRTLFAVAFLHAGRCHGGREVRQSSA